VSVIQFEKRAAAARQGATKWQIFVGRTQERLGRLLQRLGIPGAVRNVTIKDALTGQEIAVHVGVLFTCISVNGRDYYFRRLTGKFDGTGMGCGGR
jgi:hypothetical protein